MYYPTVAQGGQYPRFRGLAWVVSCLGFRVGGLGFRPSGGWFRVQGVGCSQQVGDFTSSDTQDTECHATLATPLKPGCFENDPARALGWHSWN